MFNLQGSEIIIILLLALVVLGPEKLPDAVRKFNRTYGELKKMGSGFQSEFKSAIDEPMREMRETTDIIRDAADPSKYVDPTPSTPPATPRPANPKPAAASSATSAEDAAIAGASAVSAAASLPLTADAADGGPDPADSNDQDDHERQADPGEQADPSDPGSRTIAIPGDPPAPAPPSTNRADGRNEKTADESGGGNATPTDETATA